MPLNFIPNQPYIWEQDGFDQDCLNNDSRKYAQLVAEGDQVRIQVGLQACQPNGICDPDMYLVGTQIFPFVGLPPGSFTKTNGWSENSQYLRFTGNGTAPGNASRAITTTLGQAYKLRISVTICTCPLVVNFGLTQSQTITTTGTYTMYFIAENDASATETFLGFATVPDSLSNSDQIEIYGASAPLNDTVLQPELWTITEECWSDDGAVQDGVASWQYVNTGDGITTQGDSYFCSITSEDVAPNRGDLVNYTPQFVVGEYHSVTFTVLNHTQGGIEVYAGTQLLGTATANGTYTFSAIITDVDPPLIFRKINAFAGCIFNVSNIQYIAPSLQLCDEDGNLIEEADSLSSVIVEDRAIFDFNFDPDTWGVPLPCGIYRLQLTDPCPDPDVSYVSLTAINYNTTHACSYVVEAKNEGAAFGFVFDDPDGDEVFSLIQRLRVLHFNPTYPADGQDYIDSAGQSTRTYAQSGKVYEVLFDRVDTPTHDCIRLQLLSDQLFINGKEAYATTQDYEPEWIGSGKYNLAQSRAEIRWASSPDRFNRSC